MENKIILTIFGICIFLLFLGTRMFVYEYPKTIAVEINGDYDLKDNGRGITSVECNVPSFGCYPSQCSIEEKKGITYSRENNITSPFDF